MMVPAAFTIVPTADTQAVVDETNQKLVIFSQKYKLGDLFVGEARTGLFCYYFGGYSNNLNNKQLPVIYQYRDKMNKLDGVTNKLTVQDVITDPTLAWLIWYDVIGAQ